MQPGSQRGFRRLLAAAYSPALLTRAVSVDTLIEMARKLFNLAIAFWALQISPALCLAGVLSHPCGPNEDAGLHPCESAGAHDDHAESRFAAIDSGPVSGSCSHEDDCSADPCQDVPVLQDAGSSVPARCVYTPVLFGAIGIDSTSTLRGTYPHISDPPDDLPLPRHPSDLPRIV